MTVSAAVNSSRSGGWLRRLLGSLRVAGGLLAVAGASTAPAQEPGYRPAATAPATWQAFARRVQSHFEARLAGEDSDAGAFRDYLARRGSDASASFVTSVWILPDGGIDRLEFDGLDDKEIAVHLRQLLIRGHVGAPPQDMLQPLKLRLSVRSGERPAGDK